MANLPLARFKVLDLTRARAGPTCVRHLADWGAAVIKIEAAANPQEAEDLGGARHGFDFQNLHRNKRSITLDLKQADGRAIFHRLAETADVVVENYRPDVKHRLGIDYETLRAINPRLIYGSISGFGQDGTLREPRRAQRCDRGLYGAAGQRRLGRSAQSRGRTVRADQYNRSGLCRPAGPASRHRAAGRTSDARAHQPRRSGCRIKPDALEPAHRDAGTRRAQRGG